LKEEEIPLECRILAIAVIYLKRLGIYLPGQDKTNIIAYG